MIAIYGEESSAGYRPEKTELDPYPEEQTLNHIFRQHSVVLVAEMVQH